MTPRDWDTGLPPHSPDDEAAFTEATVRRWRSARVAHARRRRAGFGVALAAAAAVAIFLALGRPGASIPEATPVATVSASTSAKTAEDRIDASPDAAYALSGPTADRVVALSEGEVLCDVTHRAPGERFRVAVGPSEIEVTGTRFRVAAANDTLQAVWVEAGQVVLRHEGHTRVLNAGDRWPAANPPTTDTAAVAAAAPPDPRVGQFLRQGLAHLDNGDADAAVEAFAAEQQLGTLAEEAHFFEAVALRLGGRPAAAKAMMDAFLEAYPRSARLGEMQCLRGKLALENGALPRARVEFAAAAAHPDARVQRCGRSGLDVLP